MLFHVWISILLITVPQEGFKYVFKLGTWMTEEQELFAIMKIKRDLILVASDELELGSTNEVKVYLFEVESVKGAAGGRAGGYGARRVSSVKGYIVRGSVSRKFYETDDKDVIESFEIPYHATAIDVLLPDGSSVVVRGVVDPELVRSYDGLTQ